MEYEKLLKTEYSAEFDELRKKAMVTSYFKYGLVKENLVNHYTDAIKSLELRLKKYKETGNTEYLVDVANFAMMEFMYPQHENAFYKPTDSVESPGLVGMSIGEIKAFKESS